ncbi:MAG: DUF4070 domain-containing protein, partial [Candidatus Binatia bacterium]
CLGRVSQNGREAPHYRLTESLRAGAHIAFKLGVLDRERRAFWHFIGRAAADHRQQFTEALRLAAMGYHFRKLAEAYERG